jgi:hypothetical protein
MSIQSTYYRFELDNTYKSFREVFNHMEHKLATRSQLPANPAIFKLLAWYNCGHHFLLLLKEEVSFQSFFKYENRQKEEHALLQNFDYLPAAFFEELWTSMIVDYAKIITYLYDVKTENTAYVRNQSQLFRSFLEWSKLSYIEFANCQVLPDFQPEIPANLDHNFRKHVSKHSEEFLYSSFYPENHWWWHFVS